MKPPEHRFFADVMLGSLARWLRLLGYDTRYDRSIDDPELVEVCVRERRIALTKDRRLVRRRALREFLLIEGVRLEDQLREVLARTGDRIDRLPLFSRCIECNGALVEVEPAQIRESVPEYTFRTHDRFRRCESCRRVYWPGTHRARMTARLRQLLGDRFETAEDRPREGE